MNKTIDLDPHNTLHSRTAWLTPQTCLVVMRNGGQMAVHLKYKGTQLQNLQVGRDA